jgi:hypothetical protein
MGCLCARTAQDGPAILNISTVLASASFCFRGLMVRSSQASIGVAVVARNFTGACGLQGWRACFGRVLFQLSDGITMKRSVLVTAALSVAAVVSGLVMMTASSVAASSLPTLTLALTPNTVTVGGSEVSGAVNVVTTVTGEKSDSPGLFLLYPGVTVAEFNKAAAALGPNTPLDAIDPYGRIVFDADATKGTPTSAQTVLVPGTYLALENGNGEAVFTVTQAAHPAALPKPSGTVTAIDFAWRGASTLRDGELVRFQNQGYLIHMFLFGQAKSVADAKKVEALLLAGKVGHGQGKQYLTGVKGAFAEPLSHGAMQQEVITQPPGVYVIFCGMNAEDGRDHYQLGMYRTIRIVK